MTIAIQPMFEAGQGYATIVLRVCSFLVHAFPSPGVHNQPTYKHLLYPWSFNSFAHHYFKSLPVFLKMLTIGVHPVLV